jgi:hypothetical protein
LTRELLQLNEQLVATTERLSASEEKRLEINRLAQQQEQKQDAALLRQPTPHTATPVGQQHSLEDMKSLLLDRAHRRKLSASAAASGGMSAHDFLGSGHSDGNVGSSLPPPVPAAATAPPPVYSANSFGSLVDAIDSIVAKSQQQQHHPQQQQQQPHPEIAAALSAPFPATAASAPSAHRQQQALEPEPSPKSHLQLLSESDDFAPAATTAASAVPQTTGSSSSSRAATPALPSPAHAARPPSRGVSPIRSTLEQHRATPLTESLGPLRSRTPLAAAAAAAAASSSSSSFSDLRSRHPSSTSEDLSDWVSTSASMSVAAVPPSFSSLSLSAPTATAASPPPAGTVAGGGPSYNALLSEVLSLRKKGAALLARYQTVQAQAAQQETAHTEHTRSTARRTAIDITQRVLQSAARRVLSRRLHQWRSETRSLRTRRATILQLLLQRHVVSESHAARVRLSQAWDAWRSFNLHAGVAALKQQWMADWQADLDAQQRKNACALIAAHAVNAQTRSRQQALLPALVRWRAHAQFVALRAHSDRELAAQAEEKQVLIALVLQHKNALEDEQKAALEARVAAERALAEMTAKLDRLAREHATSQTLIRGLDQQNDAIMRAATERAQRQTARYRATVALVEALGKGARAALMRCLRRWGRELSTTATSGIPVQSLKGVASLSAAPFERESLISSSLHALAMEEEDTHFSTSAAAASALVPPQAQSLVQSAPAMISVDWQQHAYPLPQHQRSNELTSSAPSLLHHAPPQHHVVPPVPTRLTLASASAHPSTVTAPVASYSRLAPAPPSTHRSLHSHFQQPQPAQQQHPQQQSRLHDIHKLTSSSHDESGYSAFAPHAALHDPLHSQRTSPAPPQPEAAFAGGSSGSNDVDAALRQAQETKRRLESETLEIARKIAEARARTGNYAQQQHQQQTNGFGHARGASQPVHLLQQPPPQPQLQYTPHESHMRAMSQGWASFGPQGAVAASRSSGAVGGPGSAARERRPSASPTRRQAKPEISGFYSAHMLRNKY